PPDPPPPDPPPPAPLPTMSIDRTALQFGVTTTGTSFATKTPAQLVRVIQSGSGAVTWTATSNRAWLTVSPASGSGSATLSVAVTDAYGMPAARTATITITAFGAANTPGAVSVTLSVYPGLSAAPVGYFDTPADNATGLSGSIAVTGWALDDVAVTRVRIAR